MCNVPQLRPAQQEAADFIMNSFRKYRGCMLADIPGYGKTATAIHVIKLAMAKSNRPNLIIVPAYLISNWLDELDMWGVDTDIQIIENGKTLLRDVPLYLCSYNIATAEKIFNQLFKKEFSLIVCDEAHTFRTWNSTRSRFIMGTFQRTKEHLRTRTKRLLLLTGTPLINTVVDYYNIFIRLIPKRFNFMTRDACIIEFSEHYRYTPWGLKSSGIRNEAKLKAILAPVFLRRTDITGLPARVDTYIKLSLKGYKLKEYIAREKDFLKQYYIEETDIIKTQKASAKENLMLLRQEVAMFKIPLCLPAIVDTYEQGLRPVVYCWHRKVQAALHEAVAKKCKNANIAIVNGSVPAKKRSEIVKAYQAGKLDILVATIGALREGVNLTAGRVIIIIEFPFTPAEIEQVVARLHRSGQKNIVHAKYFYFTEGIDAHIVELLKAKRDIINKMEN